MRSPCLCPRLYGQDERLPKSFGRHRSKRRDMLRHPNLLRAVALIKGFNARGRPVGGKPALAGPGDQPHQHGDTLPGDPQS